jgi:hypothetical protein
MATLQEEYTKLVRTAGNQLVVLGKTAQTPTGRHSEIVVYTRRKQKLARAALTHHSETSWYGTYQPADLQLLWIDASETVVRVGQDLINYSNLRYEAPCYVKTGSFSPEKGNCTDYPAITQIGHYCIMDLLLIVAVEMSHLDTDSPEELSAVKTIHRRIAAARTTARRYQQAINREL